MIFVFGDYELDTDLCELRQGGHVRHVEPQVFDVLVYLATHRDHLVSREELLDSVWGHRFVSLATLSSRLKAARQAVGDDGKEQRVIRTLRGRGFRFVSPVTVRDRSGTRFGDAGLPGDGVEEEPGSAGGALLAVPGPARPATRVFQTDDAADRAGGSPGALPGEAWQDGNGRAVAPPTGREVPLDRLSRLYQQATAGCRQLVFITGEPGIGKSTLAQAFLAGLPAGVSHTYGNCLEQRGSGEPYLPFLDALSRLCRGGGGGRVISVIEAHAPSWLIQMPGLATAVQLDSVRARALGATRQRMLREMVEALEEISRETPLVLVIEDLHWSDPSSLDLVSWIAQRNEPARLMVLLTNRPDESDPEVVRCVEQAMRGGRATEISLERWTAEELEAYVALRYPGLPGSLAGLAHRHTEGNPLFVTSLLDGWADSGVIALAENGQWVLTAPPEGLARGIPGSLRKLVDQRIERLPAEDIELLEVGSAVGVDFSVSLVAAAMDRDEETVESALQDLARRRQMVLATGAEDWPDGTITASFAFAHHLLRDALYVRIAPARSARLHARIATRLEAALGERGGERAAELALHYRLGRLEMRAIPFLEQAATQALSRSAHREAAVHLELALALLDRTSAYPDRPRVELRLQRLLAPARIHIRGWGDQGAERAYLRAREIAEELGEDAQLVGILYGLAYLHEIRGEFTASQALLEQRIRLEHSLNGVGATMESRELLSCSLFHQGSFDAAFQQASEAVRAADRGPEDPVLAGFGDSAVVASHYWEGLTLWFLGRPDRALPSLRKALDLSGKQQLIYMQAGSHVQIARFHQLCRQVEPALEHARIGLEIAERQGYPYHHSLALTLHGWARVYAGEADEGTAEIRAGLQGQVEAGADMERPYGLGLLADSLLHADRPEEGMAAVQEALGVIDRRARAFFWEAELLRLRGELALALAQGAVAGNDFRRAITLAAEQGSPALELRAACSLLRWEESIGQSGDGRPLLEEVYARFTEGLDLPDLVDARILLASSSVRVTPAAR